MNRPHASLPILGLANIYIVHSHAVTVHYSEEARQRLIAIARTYGYAGPDDLAAAEGLRIAFEENLLWAEELTGESTVEDDQLPLPLKDICHDA